MIKIIKYNLPVILSIILFLLSFIAPNNEKGMVLEIEMAIAAMCLIVVQIIIWITLLIKRIKNFKR